MVLTNRTKNAVKHEKGKEQLKYFHVESSKK